MIRQKNDASDYQRPQRDVEEFVAVERIIE